MNIKKKNAYGAIEKVLPSTGIEKLSFVFQTLKVLGVYSLSVIIA